MQTTSTSAGWSIWQGVNPDLDAHLYLPYGKINDRLEFYAILVIHQS